MLAHFLNKYLARIIVLYVTARYEQRGYACAVHHSFKSQVFHPTRTTNQKTEMTTVSKYKEITSDLNRGTDVSSCHIRVRTRNF